MSQTYHQINIEDSHKLLVDRHKKAICDMYRIPEDFELKILNAQEKIPDGTGLFYKFTIKDAAGRTYIVKIDKPHPMENF